MINYFIFSAILSIGLAEEIYLGSGCYWNRQHDYVELEMSSFGRTPSQVTAIGGYMFGNGRATAPACYYNKDNYSIYSDEGHAEVVKIDVPKDQLPVLFKAYFKSFVRVGENTWEREDGFDLGSGYRALIAFKNGTKNDKMMHLLRLTDPHNTTFIAGAGSDADTLGTNRIFIYDSTLFDFHQAELCLQFHNSQAGSKYSKHYHEIKDILLSAGKLHKTECPSPEVTGCL